MSDLYAFLETHGIPYARTDHPAVLTVADVERLVPTLPGARTKNLFLRDKKGARHALVVVGADTPVNLTSLADRVGFERPSFGSPDRLQKHLGIEPGAVSLLALVNDDAHAVEVFIDKDLWREPALQCHPLVNTSTLVIAREALERFLAATGHAFRLFVLLAAALLASAVTAPLAAQWPADWTAPHAPFRIADNLYYVGSQGLANYLITTPKGHILINSDLEANVPLIRASIEALGFKFRDIKILLISHAHWDHNAGSAMIKRLTGAQYQVMDADVENVESGGARDFQYGADAATHYPATTVDRVLHDGDTVRLGGAELVAHLTPGHTKGTTTWTMRVTEGGRPRDVVIVGSPNVNSGYRLVGNAAYPAIASDYERTFRVLRALPCDYFLGAHGVYFDLDAKFARMRPGAPSPFIDPDGYAAYVAERERAFRAELAKQQGTPPGN